jgi:hypothetical protein
VEERCLIEGIVLFFAQNAAFRPKTGFCSGLEYFLEGNGGKNFQAPHFGHFKKQR